MGKGCRQAVVCGSTSRGNTHGYGADQAQGCLWERQRVDMARSVDQAKGLWEREELTCQGVWGPVPGRCVREVRVDMARSADQAQGLWEWQELTWQGVQTRPREVCGRGKELTRQGVQTRPREVKS